MKSKTGSPAVAINRNCYAMASVDGDSAEIIMYGDIVDEQPMDWWTGKPAEGQYIVESDFLEDLDSVATCRTITIRMDSLGGDAGVSILIHNRLRELAANGTKLICVVDGVAMSGGSLIMCACDTVRVNPSSLVMIHKCWSMVWGGYNADELRKQATKNDAWDKAQSAIYKRKCKLSDTVINDMMADTTYMTGREAVEKGFADELLEDAEPLDIAASADGRSLFVRGKKMHLAPGMFATDKIPTVSPADEAAEINTKLPGIPGGQEGGKKPMAKTIEELRVEYPALTKQLEEEAQAAAKAPGTDETAVRAAVEAERTRQQEIDSISASIDPELVREAKFGEKACSAQELAFRAMKRQAELGEQHLAGVADDATASGGAAVAASASPADDKPSTKQEIEAQAKADAEAYAKEKEGK